MTDLIDRITAWARLLRKPRGTHRRGSSTPLGVTRLAPSLAALALPRHRSPYGLDPGTLAGEASPLVRPYLTAHEQRPYRIHGMEVA